MVYEDIYDAKNACDHLSGFNVANRYLIVLYFNPVRHNKKVGFRGTLLSVGGAFPPRSQPMPAPPTGLFSCGPHRRC